MRTTKVKISQSKLYFDYIPTVVPTYTRYPSTLKTNLHTKIFFNVEEYLKPILFQIHIPYHNPHTVVSYNYVHKKDYILPNRIYILLCTLHSTIYVLKDIFYSTYL